MTDEMPEEIWVYKIKDVDGEEYLHADDWKSGVLKTTEYRLKSTEDTEIANMKHDIERMIQTNADLVNEITGSDKTIRELAAVLEKINNARHADNARGIIGKFVPDRTDAAIDIGVKSLKDNAPRIIEAQEDKGSFKMTNNRSNKQ